MASISHRYFEAKDRRRLISSNVILWLTNIAAASYFYWLFQHAIWSWYSVIFIFSEIICIVQINLTAFAYKEMRFHRRSSPLKDFNPSVDVFLTCCGEDINIIRKTLAATLMINYPLKKIYVLDDAGSEELRHLAEGSGCVYFHRGTREYTKAGNLNNGLKHSTGDFILVLDADQEPRPYIIKKLIGYFIRPNIAFVQSMQHYDVPENDPYNSQDLMFNKSVELSKDAHNAIISCGSGVIYKRSALDAIGGFSTWNLVEDLHTSYRLQQSGYVGIFFNYALTKGIAPPHYAAMARQRHKWAMDTLRLFFWDNPLFKKGLTVEQKVHYFGLGILYLFSGICIPIFFLLPIWSLLTNSFFVNVPAGEFLLYRLPYFGMMVILDVFIFRSKGVTKCYQTWNSFFPIFFQAIIDALWHKKLKLEPVVTFKNEPKETRLPWYCTVSAQMVILIAYVVSFCYSVWTFGINKNIFFGNLVWMLWSVFVLAPLTISVFLEQLGYIFQAGQVSLKMNKVTTCCLCGVLCSMLVYYPAPADVILLHSPVVPLVLRPRSISKGKVVIPTNPTFSAPKKAAVAAVVVNNTKALALTTGDKTVSVVAVSDNPPTSKQIQQALKNAGFYTGKIDGKVGPLTLKAIKDFQSKNSLSVDGKVGPKTWKVLSVHLGLPTPVPVTVATQGVLNIYKQSLEIPLKVQTSPVTNTQEQPIARMDTSPAEVSPSQRMIVGENTRIETPPHQPAKRITRFTVTPMYSVYWEDTKYLRINEGTDFKMRSKDGKDTYGLLYYVSQLSGNNAGHINRNSFKASYATDLNKNLSLYLDGGFNSYTNHVGETFTGKSRVVYNHEHGNVGFEYSHYDIIDTIDLFTPRYYTLVSDVQAAIHRITTHDFKVDAYQTLSKHWALYGNATYGLYSDGNIKKMAYISPMYLLNPNWTLKYGFSYIDLLHTSPYYFAHNNSQIHQFAVEYNKKINDRWSFNAENTLSYDIKQGFGDSIFTGFRYRIKDNMTFDVSLKYSFSDDKTNNSHTNSLGVTCGVKIDF
ncbi:MAG: glycosyltransferase [Candidatus Omnitrophica bacterium]|nr:glycosyltransferase [Candidatus Omnitrophota bacterium]